MPFFSMTHFPKHCNTRGEVSLKIFVHIVAMVVNKLVENLLYRHFLCGNIMEFLGPCFTKTVCNVHHVILRRNKFVEGCTNLFMNYVLTHSMKKTLPRLHPNQHLCTSPHQRWTWPEKISKTRVTLNIKLYLYL